MFPAAFESGAVGVLSQLNQDSMIPPFCITEAAASSVNGLVIASEEHTDPHTTGMRETMDSKMQIENC